MDLYVVGPDQDLDIEMVNSTPTDPVPIGEGVTVRAVQRSRMAVSESRLLMPARPAR